VVLDNEDEFRHEFDDGLRVRISRVYRSAGGRFPDHRAEYGWVTGYLGDVFALVWFVAENPSLTQVEKISDPDPSPELQWTMSKGHLLFRGMLWEHGFKDGTSPTASGG